MVARAHAVVVAAGSGQRAGGGVPKAWRAFLGRPLVDWSVAAFLRHEGVAGVSLVVAPDRVEAARTRFAGAGVSVVPGGASRALSVRAGLDDVRATDPLADTVLIHDAARPGLSGGTVSALLAALEAGHDGAAPALPVVDALKRMEGERVSAVARDGLWRIQTPQAFRLDVIARALAQDGAEGALDDFEAAQAIGARLTLTLGDEALMKITYEADFDLAARLIAPLKRSEVRTGHGFDVHGFEPGEAVILCGVTIPHSHRLQGHSDADAGWHALTDAILGAACLGDIGDHFPPSDPKWRGAPSEVFLRHAVEIVGRKGWQMSHADVTLICEAPKIKPHREAMRAATARVCGLDVDAVSVKATTTETLGFTGRREGLAAMATATLTRTVMADSGARS